MKQKRIFKYFILLILSMTTQVELKSQCEYIISLGDTWGDEWGGANVKVRVFDQSGMRVLLETITNDKYTRIGPGQPLKSVEYFTYNVPCGHRITFNYTSASFSGDSIQLDEDNFIRITQNGNEVFYAGDSTSTYKTISNSDVMTRSSDFQDTCDCTLLKTNPINIKIFHLPMQGRTDRLIQIDCDESFLSNVEEIEIYRQASGSFFDRIATKKHIQNNTYLDIDCFGEDVRYIYYSVKYKLKGGDWKQTPVQAIEIEPCKEYRAGRTTLDGRQGGSIELILDGQKKKIIR